jgi:hypothetical protein
MGLFYREDGASGTWTRPSNVKKVYAFGIGGGGPSDGASYSGGGGGYGWLVPDVSSSSTLTVQSGVFGSICYTVVGITCQARDGGDSTVTWNGGSVTGFGGRGSFVSTGPFQYSGYSQYPSGGGHTGNGNNGRDGRPGNRAGITGGDVGAGEDDWSASNHPGGGGAGGRTVIGDNGRSAHENLPPEIAAQYPPCPFEGLGPYIIGYGDSDGTPIVQCGYLCGSEGGQGVSLLGNSVTSGSSSIGICGAGYGTTSGGNAIGGGYGGGGGLDVSYYGCRGGPGAAGIAWVDINSVSKTTLTPGETATVSWSSPFGSGTSVAGPFTNTTEGNITVEYDVTDPIGAQSTVTFTILAPTKITNFTYNPSPQNSSTGTPQYSVQLFWSVTGGNGSFTHTITNLSTGQVYNNVSSGMTLSGLPQSNANGNSPASVNVKLTSTDGSTSDEETITIQVRNDNTPSNSWTASFINLEPSTEYSLSLGQLEGVDMPTIASAAGDGNFVGKSVNGPFGNPLIFNNGEGVFLKFTSMPFNTTVPSSGTFGFTNSKTISVTIGSQAFNVTVTTRAPRVAEDFNYFDKEGEYPYQDIDLISNNPTQYLTTANVVTNDIEIPVEIKASDPGVQVNINGSGWQNVRSI